MAPDTAPNGEQDRVTDSAAAWVCPLCQDKGMVLVTLADGTQEIVPCSAQCVRKAGLDAD